MIADDSGEAMDKLRISDNGRYFVHESGEPFLWLADTAWTIPSRLKWDDVIYYLQCRKEQGFTVLQMVALDPEHNEEMRNPAGIPALRDNDLLKPNEAYFDYLDWVLDKAEEYGFYVLLLPVWGELVVGWDWSGNSHEKTVTEDNAYQFGSWMGHRMRHRNNLLWCLGGDRMPICGGEDYRSVWRKLAEGLSFGLTGETLRYNQDRDKWKSLLMTYHPCREPDTGLCSTLSYWGEEEAWISYVMLQSGHIASKKNYELIRDERARSRIYPVWDGEPAYEMMPTTWPFEDEPSYFGTGIVRQRAYCSLLAGSFGFTYGHASVWCAASGKDRDKFCPMTWDEAIHSEGSRQMTVLRKFMEQFALHEFVPCQDRLLRQASEKDELERHEQAAYSPDRHQMLVYFSADTAEEIDLNGVFNERIYGGWFDPVNGSVTQISDCMNMDNGTLHIRNCSENGADRVLILTPDPSDLSLDES